MSLEDKLVRIKKKVAVTLLPVTYFTLYMTFGLESYCVVSPCVKHIFIVESSTQLFYNQSVITRQHQHMITYTHCTTRNMRRSLRDMEIICELSAKRDTDTETDTWCRPGASDATVE